LSAAELIFAKKIQKNLKKKKKIIDNIYINKDIYTYIPNPDPDIPIPIDTWSMLLLPGRYRVQSGPKANNCSDYYRVEEKNLIFTW